MWALLVAAAIAAVSFLVLLTVRVPARDSAERGGEEGGNESKSVMAGIRFVFGHPVFLAAIGLSFATSVFGVWSIGLLGVFVADLPGVGPRVVLLSALAGGGGLAAALWVVGRGIGGRPGVLMLASAASYGVLIAVFVATVSISSAFVLPLLLLVGFAAGLYPIIGMTMMQLLVPDRLRGRVMGIWSMTTHLAVVGGIMTGLGLYFVGLGVTLAAGALAVGGVRHYGLRGVGRAAPPARRATSGPRQSPPPRRPRRRADAQGAHPTPAPLTPLAVRQSSGSSAAITWRRNLSRARGGNRAGPAPPGRGSGRPAACAGPRQRAVRAAFVAACAGCCNPWSQEPWLSGEVRQAARQRAMP